MIDKKILGLAALSGLVSACSTSTSNPSNHAGETQYITILQTADIHGQLYAHDELFWENDRIHFKTLGGLASVKTLFEREREANPKGTIILDGGDLIQGSAEAALSEGNAFGPIVKAMGYDFIIPGNWEVVYGKQQMTDVLESYETPVISANMYHHESRDPLFPPYFIREVHGVKLGFISYNDPEIPIRQNPSFSEGIRFDSIRANLDALIAELKDEKGVDVLFLVTHIGISKQFDLANHPALERVDYILGNDTHERIRTPLDGKFAKVTEPGAFASFVGKLTLKVENGRVTEDTYELLEVDPDVYPPHTAMSELIARETAQYRQETETIIGYSSTPLYRYFVVENPMDNFITDAARWKTGVDISISNGFRFSPPIALNANGVAPITEGHLWNMLPVNEKVKTGKATGEQIASWLESELHHVFAQNPTERFGGWLVRFSGMEIEFYANRPEGERIASILVDGEPLQTDKLYTLSACRREGEADNMLCRMPNILEPQIMEYTIHDAVKEYLQFHDTISPAVESRAQALDLGDDVLSQLPGTSYHFH
ncbi:MAG: bifunctional metallophosphatase/5'-nucleotidase [Bacteroidetes bacterium]|nr:MAG: bifunctional metallophosphatase/5'-nucleotidase [Bacteroidota bacterium]